MGWEGWASRSKEKARILVLGLALLRSDMHRHQQQQHSDDDGASCQRPQHMRGRLTCLYPSHIGSALCRKRALLARWLRRRISFWEETAGENSLRATNSLPCDAFVCCSSVGIRARRLPAQEKLVTGMRCILLASDTLSVFSFALCRFSEESNPAAEQLPRALVRSSVFTGISTLRVASTPSSDAPPLCILIILRDQEMHCCLHRRRQRRQNER